MVPNVRQGADGRGPRRLRGGGNGSSGGEARAVVGSGAGAALGVARAKEVTGPDAAQYPALLDEPLRRWVFQVGLLVDQAQQVGTGRDSKSECLLLAEPAHGKRSVHLPATAHLDPGLPDAGWLTSWPQEVNAGHPAGVV